MSPKPTDKLLLAIADEIDRKTTRRHFERILVDADLYSLAVLTEDMGEYESQSKPELIRSVLLELRSQRTIRTLLVFLEREGIISEASLLALEAQGFQVRRPLPETRRRKTAERVKPQSNYPSSGPRERAKSHGSTKSKRPSDRRARWDVFISHASEDKREIAGPLARALRKKGLSVWYDEYTLRLGDNLARSIDEGLAHSRYGIVIISRSFLAKEWPRRELDALVSREVRGKKVILPVWHHVGAATIRKKSPLLASKLAVSSSRGLETVVRNILAVVRPGG